MNQKLIAIFSIMLIFLFFVSVVSADNESDTNDSTVMEETVVETDVDGGDGGIDLSGYITAISLGGDMIQFSDGFTGYKIDPSKNDVSQDDGFTAGPTSSAGGNANYYKLAIIESYRACCENNIDGVIASFADGSYQSSSDPVVQAVLASDETVGDHVVVMIDNETEATFDFEVLTPIDGETSSYFAYTASFAPVSDGKLAASPTDVENDTLASPDAENDTLASPDAENDTLASPDSENDTLAAPDNSKNDTLTSQSSDNASDNGTLGASQKETADGTAVNQTNRTVVNRTNTTIVNEKNTTIINKNNVRVANQPQQEPPIQERILKAAGNPIFILIAVIVLGGAAAIALRRRKD